MSVRTVTIMDCDRCGVDLDPSDKNGYLVVGIGPTLPLRAESGMVLCPACGMEFWGFMGKDLPSWAFKEGV